MLILKTVARSAFVVLLVAAAAFATAQPPVIQRPQLPPFPPPRPAGPLEPPPFVGPVLTDAGVDDDSSALPEPDVSGGVPALEADPAAVPSPAAGTESDDPSRPAAPPRGQPVGSEPILSLAQRAAEVLGFVLEDGSDGEVRVPVAGGAADLAQSLAQAVFAAPVAGSIPYVVHAEVYHDVTIVLPDNWTIVSVFVGDPARWALYQVQHLVVLKPGEPGIRTNLTVVLANGDVLQMDLQEVTGLPGVDRTGRVYVGPESWLVDRIFGMLPLAVRHRVARSPATVAELLVDPLTVIGLYGGTGAVPNPLSAATLAGPRTVRLPDVVPPPTLGALDGVEPLVEVAPLPAVAPATPLPTSSSTSSLPAPVAQDRDAAVLVSSDLVAGGAVASLEADLRSAVNRVDSSRIAAGDRIAAAQLNVEAEVEMLREEYPLRTQFSYVFEPDVTPYTEPFWHFGAWHDGERTYWRLLAGDPVFRDDETGEILVPELLGDYLYRFNRVVDRGVLTVLPPGNDRPIDLFFRRRRELEGP